MVCTNAAELYCAPTQNAGCVESKTYVLEYNKAFKSINKVSLVDIYLYHADDGSLASKISNQANDGSYSFTIDKKWFPDPPTTTQQFFPYRWYVVQAGKQFNVAPSSQSMGDAFFAVETQTIAATSTKAGTTSRSSSVTSKATFARATEVESTSAVSSFASASKTSAGTTSAIAFPGSSASATASSVPAASSVSSGAVAGIVIAVIGAVAALAIAFFMVRRRKQQNRKQSFRGPFDTEKFGPSKGFSRGSKDTEMDVPLTFVPGTAPGTPKTMPGTPKVGATAPRGSDGSQSTLVDAGTGYETMTPPRSPNRQLIEAFPMPAPRDEAAPSPLPTTFPLTPAERAQTPNGSVRSMRRDSPPGQSVMPWQTGPLTVRPQSPMGLFPPSSRPGTPVRQFQGPPAQGARPQTPTQLNQGQGPPYTVGPPPGSRPGTPTQYAPRQGPPDQYGQGQGPPGQRGMGPQGPPGVLPYPVGAGGPPRMRPQTPQDRRQSPPQQRRPQTPQDGNPFSDPRDPRSQRPQSPQNGPFADPRRPYTPREGGPPRSQNPGQYPPRSQNPVQQPNRPPQNSNQQRPPPGPRSSGPVEPQPALIRSNSKRGVDAAFPLKKPVTGSVDLSKSQLPWDDIDPPYLPAKVTPAKVSVVKVGDQGQRASIKSVEGRVSTGANSSGSGSTVRDSAGSIPPAEKEVKVPETVTETPPSPVAKDVEGSLPAAIVTPRQMTVTVTPPTDNRNTPRTPSPTNPFQTNLPKLPSMIVDSPSPSSVFTMPTTNGSSTSLPQVASRPTSSLVDIYSRDSFVETPPLSIAKAAAGAGEQGSTHAGVDGLEAPPKLPALEQGRPLSLGI